ncbi:MAG: ImmA/IrrE family metallo-endopeptidase [Clostridia bacterium]|nr:ImmA/IrrE family metallo-endopeptidase [Clostridia bacterium]
MYYGIYKNIRESAWKCLSEFNISSLPVDILKIARQVGIHVKKNSDVHDLMPGELGKSYFNGYVWFIIYDDSQPVDVCRFTIAHELGHFFLGHDLTYSKYSEIRGFSQKAKEEEQADAFALRLLTPACVLKELDLHTPEEIAKYCNVPLSCATERSKRMKTLYKRNMFFTSQLETEVYENFKPYVRLANRRKAAEEKKKSNE